ncbi:hypothetical protein GN956_G9669 [Arapaima gigas]
MAAQQDGAQQATRLKDCNIKQEGVVDGFELYVPKDAELCTVAVEMLPLSILKRMNQFSTLTKRNGVSEGHGSPTATWISPVVVREQRALQGCNNSGTAKARLSKMAMESAASHVHCWLPITCSHLAAFKVLKQFLPSGQGQQYDPKKEEMLKACQDPPAHQGGTLNFTQDSIIICGGQIFLSIKSPQQASCSRSWRQSPGSRAATLPTGQHTERRSYLSCTRCGRSSSTVQQDHPGGSWELSELQRRFGITRHVHVALRRIPAASLEKRGSRTPEPRACGSEDQDGQTSPSGGRVEEQGAGDAKAGASCESEGLEDRKQRQVVDRGKLLAVEPEEEEPAVKNLKLSLSPDILPEEESCDELVHGRTGKCEVDLSESEHQSGDAESERAVEGGAEQTAPENACRDGIQAEDRNPTMSVFYRPSAVEDVMVVDFEQLAREERISRIREKLREKEAAVRSMDSLS